MTLRLEPLNRSHRPLLADFQNPQASLVDDLQRYALRHAEKDLLARTYLALDAGAGVPRLAGYFSLATVSVDRAAVAQLPELDRLPRFPIPGILLARLAVDTRVRGQGLGRYLFEAALGLTLQLAQTGPVAPRPRLRANGFCSRLAGQRAACGRDARGGFEHWTVRLGAVWLRGEVRGPSAPVGGERDTPWRGVRSVRV
ncbi:MAG: hypothetical protein P9F75_07510 [Candidatus Contendobacter sp.]|nr:hypothetical protein [Candidatus Contendobacter sp.]